MIETLDALRSAAPGVAGNPGAEANIGDIAVDRHVRAGHGNDTALRWIGPDRADLDDPLDLSFEMVASRSTRFAGALRHQGIDPGAVVATLLGRVPDLYVAALGTWKARAVLAALTPSCDPDVTAEHLRAGRVRVVVTSPALFRRTLAPILHRLPALELVLVCGASEDQSAGTHRAHHARAMSCGVFLRESTEDFTAEVTDPDEAALLRFTSGGTGVVDPIVDTHRVVARRQHATRSALALHRGDTFWWASDADGMTSLAGAMATGARSIVDESGIDPVRWWYILRHHHVDVLAMSPEALELLRESADDDGATVPPELRIVATVGGALDAATAAWVRSYLGAPVLDLSSTEH